MALCTGTLIRFKKNRQQWIAFLSDKTKVFLSLSDLKIMEGESLRDIRPAESWPKLERQKTVVLQLEEKPEPKINAWALAPI
ncbi:MAG TPA: hypothetical protein VIJ88_02450 [Candidatus Paceibacterota bacterium]